jgi:hypothetical protein
MNLQNKNDVVKSIRKISRSISSPHGLRGGVGKESKKESKKGSEKESKKDIKKESKKDSEKELKKNSKKDIKKESKKGSKKELKKDSKKDIKKESKKGSEKELKKDSKKDIKKESKKGSEKELKKDIKKESKKGSEKELKKSSGKESKKGSKKDIKKDSKPKKQPIEKIYCGSQEPMPKPYNKYGSMKECKDKKQVKRYGLYKIDSKIINSVDDKNKDNKNALLIKRAGLIGKVSRFKRLLKNQKLTEKEIQTLKDDANKIIREIKSLNILIFK